jgi:hypothetical protein
MASFASSGFSKDTKPREEFIEFEFMFEREEKKVIESCSVPLNKFYKGLLTEST